MHSRALQALKTYRFALPWLLLKKSLAGIVRIETLVVFRFGLPAPAVTSSSNPPGLELELVTDPNSPTFGALCARYPEKDFENRFRSGGRQCYVALSNSHIAGYAWVSAESLYVDEIARVYPLAADEVFIYDCFVDAAYRGQGIYPAMLRAALQQCHKARGKVRQAVIAAVATNYPSIRGITKAGFSEWKRIRYAGWGRKQHWWGLDAPCARTA